MHQRGTVVDISLDADVVEEYVQRRHVRQITVRRQKRLAVGLFPGAAELVWMPRGALASAQGLERREYDLQPYYCGYYADWNPGLVLYACNQVLGGVFSLGIIPAVTTCESLLVAPFEPWQCDSHDFIDPEHWRRGVKHGGKWVADASTSPHVRALADLPEGLRREIGARTCFDVRSTGSMPGEHFGLVGFHKYLAVFVEIAEPETVLGAEMRRKKAVVPGPFEVELGIPGVGFSERRLVPPGESSVRFELPCAPYDMAIEARVQVREARNPGNGEIPELTRSAVRDLMGQGSRFDVNLRAARAVTEAKKFAYEVMEIRSVG